MPPYNPLALVSAEAVIRGDSPTRTATLDGRAVEFGLGAIGAVARRQPGHQRRVQRDHVGADRTRRAGACASAHDRCATSAIAHGAGGARGTARPVALVAGVIQLGRVRRRRAHRGQPLAALRGGVCRALVDGGQRSASRAGAAYRCRGGGARCGHLDAGADARRARAGAVLGYAPQRPARIRQRPGRVPACRRVAVPGARGAPRRPGGRRSQVSAWPGSSCSSGWGS